jgi:hypothetical protein
LGCGLRLTGRLSLVLLVLHALLYTLLLGLVLSNFHSGRQVTGRCLSTLPCLRVLTLDIRVGRCDTGLVTTVSVDNALVDLVTLSIDDTRSCLVACLEADFAGELSNLLIVEDAAVLVAVLNALLFGKDGELLRNALRWRRDDGCLGNLRILLRLLVYNRGSGCGRRGDRRRYC